MTAPAAQHPMRLESLEAAPDFTLTEGEMRLFQELMYEEAGIRMADAKINLVQSRLRKRLEALELGSFRAYHAYATAPGHQDELQRCLEALTTNETFFFRHKQHWDFLIGELLPQWRRSAAAGATFRAWSAASSTGEEPYSLAIALDAALKGSGLNARIDATDINTQVLARARSGIYTSYALQKITPQCLKRYFTPCQDGQRQQVIESIRSMVTFRQHNLTHASGGQPYDLILLRNVLIYFDQESKGAVMAQVGARLRPGGWLILGGAESLSDRQGAFDYHRPTIYRKR
jgi:chemotaxis protein methyltransferase CheR